MDGNEELSELLSWVRIIAVAPLRDLLEEYLDSEESWRAYEATDGSRNREQVAEIAGVSPRTIGNRWKEWREAGLLLDLPNSDYPRHIASASSVGLPLSELDI